MKYNEDLANSLICPPEWQMKAGYDCFIEIETKALKEVYGSYFLSIPKDYVRHCAIRGNDGRYRVTLHYDEFNRIIIDPNK